MTKRHNMIVLSIALIVSAGILINAFHKGEKEKRFLSRAIRLPDGGWGYEILVNDSVFIHQEFIPGAKHKIRFTSKEDAEQTAALIIGKMRNGRSPSITEAEVAVILSNKKQ